MDIHEVKKILGITQQTVYQHIRAGNLNPVKNGRSWVFDGQEVYTFLRKRNVASARSSPTNAPRGHVVNSRTFPPEAIQPLLERLIRFQSRYEHRTEFQLLFDFKYTITAVFYHTFENDEHFTGLEVNEVLSEIDMLLQEGPSENHAAWEILHNRFEEAFLETNEEFDRSDIYEDLILDVAIELAK